MKQPRVFAREQVIDAAWELIREHGWKQVTARSIAGHLGSSTMPIYSHMKSLDDLEKELKDRSRKLMHDYQMRDYTGNPVLDIAVGYVVFARDEKQLFRFLFLDRPDVRESEDVLQMRDSFYEQFGSQETEDEMISGMSPKAQEGLIRNSHIFSHGLAMMVNAGIIHPCANEMIRGYLEDAGEAFYLLELRKEEKSE